MVIGTTGFSKKEENLIKKYSRKIPILKAGNMSLGINLLMYLTEIASKSLGNNFLSKVFEVHHRHKKDHPSGTALMLGQGIAIGKNKDFNKLIGKINREGLTLVPTKMYFKKGKAKIEIAVAKGKKQYDKRQTKKTRDWNRDKARYVRKSS